MMAFTRKVATQEQMRTNIAEIYRNRILNPQSFTYRSCVDCDAEEKWMGLPELVEIMNAKIIAKKNFLKQSYSSSRHPSYENYLTQLEGESSPTEVIDPFDFSLMQPSRAVTQEIIRFNHTENIEDTIRVNLTSTGNIKFLSYVLSLDLEGDTTLSLHHIYRD